MENNDSKLYQVLLHNQNGDVRALNSRIMILIPAPSPSNVQAKTLEIINNLIERGVIPHGDWGVDATTELFSYIQFPSTGHALAVYEMHKAVAAESV
jgi:hypothetical protein